MKTLYIGSEGSHRGAAAASEMWPATAGEERKLLKDWGREALETGCLTTARSESITLYRYAQYR